MDIYKGPPEGLSGFRRVPPPFSFIVPAQPVAPGASMHAWRAFCRYGAVQITFPAASCKLRFGLPSGSTARIAPDFPAA